MRVYTQSDFFVDKLFGQKGYYVKFLENFAFNTIPSSQEKKKIKTQIQKSIKAKHKTLESICCHLNRTLSQIPFQSISNKKQEIILLFFCSFAFLSEFYSPKTTFVIPCIYKFQRIFQMFKVQAGNSKDYVVSLSHTSNHPSTHLGFVHMWSSFLNPIKYLSDILIMKRRRIGNENENS